MVGVSAHQGRTLGGIGAHPCVELRYRPVHVVWHALCITSYVCSESITRDSQENL